MCDDVLRIHRANFSVECLVRENDFFQKDQSRKKQRILKKLEDLSSLEVVKYKLEITNFATGTEISYKTWALIRKL